MIRKITTPVGELERSKGRMVLWLDQDDLWFLARQWQDVPDDAADEVKQRWSKIQFPVHAPLHKAGLKDAPAPDDPS